MKLILLLCTLFINILANAQLPIPKSDDENIIQAQADFLLENEEYLKAQLKFDTIINNSNYESIDLYYRGLCKYNLNDNIGAIVDFTKTLNFLKDTDLAENWMHGPRTHIINDKYQYMQGAVLFNHYYYHLFFYRANAKMNLKDYYGAIKDFNSYSEFNKEDDTALIEIARCYINLNDFKNSIIYLDKAIKTNDNNPESFLLRGHSYIQIGDKEKGCLDLSKAGELGNEKVYELITKICN